MIKTWKERTPAGQYLAGIDRLQEVMQAEIDELRAELAKPKTTPMSESNFIKWFGRNYPCDTVIFDPDWHARSIYRKVTHTANQAKEQDDRREGLGAHHAYCRALGG